MKSRCPNSSARWTLLLLALAVSTATSFAQNVGGFIHGKIQNFQQTSPAAPVVNSAQPFQFGSLITMGTATINSATLTFSGTASPRTYSAVVGSGDFSILDTFTTQAQLDSAYQNGNFTVSIDTSAGIFSRSIFLLPFSYPTTPQLTVPANNWQSGALVIDPALDYTFTWNAFANAQAADVIELVIRNSGVSLNPFPATQTSFTLPAGSLQPGTTYTCDLAFVRVAGVAAADPDIGAGYATFVKDTGFTISSTGPTPTPSPNPTPTPTTTPIPSATPTPTATHTPTPIPTPTPSPVPTPTPTPVATPTPTPRPATLGNISTRLQVGTADRVMIAGFIVQGSAPKKVLIRAAGPSLTQFGVPNALANPRLELHDANNTIGMNDNWQTTQLGGVITSDQVAEIQNSGLAPRDPAESALIATLPPGTYTAIVQGVSGGTGVGIVEAYDLNATSGSLLANISTRGFVQTADNVMIGGFIVVTQPTKVIIRAIGPSLTQFGVPDALVNPQLELHDANNTIARNDDWQTTQLGGIITSDQVAAIQNSQLAPTNPAESAIIATLQPGSYTAIVRGVNNTTGNALVEVYSLP
jgi:hypothetical protein